MLPIFNYFSIAIATSEIYTLSLHDALPIFNPDDLWIRADVEETYIDRVRLGDKMTVRLPSGETRSEEHTSELQSHSDLVCRLLLEKKKAAGGRVSGRRLGGAAPTWLDRLDR